MVLDKIDVPDSAANVECLFHLMTGPLGMDWFTSSMPNFEAKCLSFWTLLQPSKWEEHIFYDGITLLVIKI